MARRSSAASCRRGGESISTPRPGRARLITGGLSVVTLAAVTAYAFSGGDTVASAGGGLCAAGTIVLAIGVLLRFSFPVPWGVLLAGAGYVLARAHHSAVDGWAAVVAAALLLAAELAAWSIASDRRVREERALVVRQSLTVGVLVVAAGLISFVLVGAAAISTTAGLMITAVGVAAAVGAVAVVLRLVR